MPRWWSALPLNALGRDGCPLSRHSLTEADQPPRRAGARRRAAFGRSPSDNPFATVSRSENRGQAPGWQPLDWLGALSLSKRQPATALASPPARGFISRMTLTLDQIVDETRQLTPEVRAALVERIILAGHGGIEPKVDEAWKQVSRQRIAEIRSGKIQGVPVDVALAEMRKLAGL